MLKFKKILFPTDFSSCADQAFSHAVYLAREYKAELHMLHASMLFTADYFGYMQDVYLKLRQLAMEHIASVIESHKAEDLKIEKVEKPAASPASFILEYAEENDIDLIIMGTHGRRGFGHLFLGSIAEEVVRLAPCPVFTVREREEPMAAAKLSRILVPIDFSEHSRKALSHAKEIASTYGARLQLLHVIEEPIYPAFYMAFGIYNPSFLPDLEEESRKELRKLLEESEGPKVEADIYVTHGRAAFGIIRFAETNGTDLIVTATHGLTGIKHLLIGSVAEKVVRLAPCPVFTLKAFGKKVTTDDQILYSTTDGK
jgi:nucleotide-binding universal stress UspA family protein